MNTPWLTDAEVDDLCDGLSLNAVRVRHLRRMGLTVTVKPNGRPLVIRAHAERVLSGGVESCVAANDPKPVARPNRDALIHHFRKNYG